MKNITLVGNPAEGPRTDSERTILQERSVAAEMRERWMEWQAADNEWLRNADQELQFLEDPWIDPDTGINRAQQLRSIGRSAYNVDLLSPSIDIVVNGVRINKMTATFIPESEGADVATAEIRQGLYASIDRLSKANVARETAFDFATKVGRGYWRVTIEDEDGPTLNRQIRIRRVDNLKSIAIDQSGLEFDYSDARWAIVYDEISKDEYHSRWPDGDIEHQPLDLVGMELDEGSRGMWFPKDKVRFCEYYRKVFYPREAVALSDGREVWANEVPPGAVIIRQKRKTDFRIERRLMSGTQTLEKGIWPGRYIPIVVCVGTEKFRGRAGKIHTGMVRKAMHSVLVHNYLYSRMVDEVALSPLPHMMSAKGQFTEQDKKIVGSINSRPWEMLEYDPISDAQGRFLPMPAWVSPSANIVAVIQAAEASKDNLQRVLNTYAPQLGRVTGDQSGRAIREIKDAGDVSHFSMPDNFNRALLAEATIVNDLMDHVYTEKQVITITRPDETTKRVLINGRDVDKRTGKETNYLFGQGKYGIAVSTGPAYASQMQKAGDKLLDLAKIFPGQVALTLDQLIQDLNIPNAQKYAERLRPPQFPRDEEDGPSMMELQQQVAEYEQNAQKADALIEQLMAKVQELGNAEATKRLEIASRERIAQEGNATRVMIEDMKAGNLAAHAVLLKRLDMLLQDLNAGSPETGLAPENQGAENTALAPLDKQV